MAGVVRIDKWLWAVRLFKTRNLAAEACKKGRIYINTQLCKPSKIIAIGDEIEIKRPPVTFKYKVLDLAEKRMGAKLVSGFMQDITPKDQLEILELQKLNMSYNRQKGLGRPTKKERRDLENFSDWMEDED